MVRYQLAVGLQKGHKVTRLANGRKDRPTRRKGVSETRGRKKSVFLDAYEML